MNHSNKIGIYVAAVCCAALLALGNGPACAAEEAAAPMDEASLIAVIAGDADWTAKQSACRALRQIGTAESVPALAALLPDEAMSHLARFALEPMDCPEAGQALRDALGATAGGPKVGVITSLGARRDVQAVPLLRPLVGDSDVDVARAAAGALGRIASRDAIGALLDARGEPGDALEPAVTEGLLAAGQALTRDGKGKAAAKVFAGLLDASAPIQVQMGAFQGLAYARPGRAPARLIAALEGDDPLFRDLAAQIVAEGSGTKTTKRYAAALHKLPPAGQAALLRGLADRDDPAARPAVLAAVENGDVEVKRAAVAALGALGNSAEDVNALTGLLTAANEDIAAAAKASLAAMQGDAVDTALAAAIQDAAPALHAQLLGLLAVRRADSAIPLAVAAVADGDAAVRIGGFDAIALLGNKDEAGAVVAALNRAAGADERAAAEKALNAVCSRAGEAVLPTVLGAMQGGAVEVRLVLLGAAARIGGAKGLEAVVAAIEDPEKGVSEEALRIVSNWPTLDAAPHLSALAQSDDLQRQVLGLRGYVRLARQEGNAEKKIQMLAKAMELARRPDERKLVIAAWGTVPTTQSLDALKPLLGDPAVRDETALAIVAVAQELAKNDAGKQPAKAALQAVLAAKVQNADAVNAAKKAFEAIK
ncbi:MAG: HEAT repeat domain-containing protein [Candidatus Hydrogenedentes bacterium]|nr:HEAT repeat domain-containing protein [Candidatus Hydrogenedentota bacterium]